MFKYSIFNVLSNGALLITWTSIAPAILKCNAVILKWRTHHRCKLLRTAHCGARFVVLKSKRGMCNEYVTRARYT